MALDPNVFVDFSFVRDVLGLEESEQTRVDRLIKAACAAANKYTHRLLAGREHVAIVDGNGKTSMLLDEYPVTDVDKVYIDTSRAFAATSLVTDYLIYEDTGELYYSGGFPAERQCVKIEYTAGYDFDPTASPAVDDVPLDLKMAVAEIIRWQLSRIDGESIGMRAVQNPDGIVTQYELDIPASARARLDAYVRIR